MTYIPREDKPDVQTGMRQFQGQKISQRVQYSPGAYLRKESMPLRGYIISLEPKSWSALMKNPLLQAKT